MFATQFNHDVAEPENHDAEDAFFCDQAESLLRCGNADGVTWEEFAQVASENVADADTKEFHLLQLLLAVRNKNDDLVHQIYDKYFDRAVCESAEAMVKKAN